MECAKAVVSSMRGKSESSIVNLSSVAGPIVANSGEVAYATTKDALNGFTKALTMELDADHIRINTILPSYILTPMVEGLSKETNPNHLQGVIDEIANGIPIKRMESTKNWEN